MKGKIINREVVTVGPDVDLVSDYVRRGYVVRVLADDTSRRAMERLRGYLKRRLKSGVTIRAMAGSFFISRT